MSSVGSTFFKRTLLLLIFGFVNAAIFTLIENREENYKTTSNRMLQQMRKNFTKHHNFSDEEFEYFAIASYNAVHMGLSLDWTYFRAVDFTYTAMTTIGYGRLTPITTYGKLFCIVFCMLGIPLCLLTLKSAGELISEFLTCVITRVEIIVLKTKTVKDIEIKRALLAFALMAVYLSFTAVTQVIKENWTFVDAFYASFIAYSTVGFGDYILFESVTGQGKNGAASTFFHVFATFPALFGLGIVACVINCVLDVVEKKHLHLSDGFCCRRSRRLGRRKNKESMKLLSFSKLDKEGRRTRRSHSV
ncbi:two pore potassium channel protein sup-9-like [Stylophora pistillata]|uniref:two pore potassium channel protein sup-9-like n=1 Tax=Stylophora pistillata TaxID=50429 RepID=UPI000C040461|nr:two pore potassium channel protein sup-9-like [Stylophora pistillata]